MISSLEHNNKRRDVIAVMISSQPVKSRYEYGIKDWLVAGMRRPSKVVCDHIVTIEKTSMIKVGHMANKELVEVKKIIAEIMEI